MDKYDSLFDCIKAATSKLRWKSVKTFKYWIDQQEVDDIITAIENHQGMRIEVIGDEIHESEYESINNVVLTLKLKDGVYTATNTGPFQTKKWVVKGVNPVDRKLIVWEYMEDQKNIRCYDGAATDGILQYRIALENYRIDVKGTKNFGYDRVHKLGYYCEYVYVKLNKRKFKSVKEQWQKLDKDWQQIRTASNGEIQMGRYGYTPLATKAMWRQTVLHLNPDPIGPKEAEVIMLTKNGGLVSAVDGYEGPGYLYDFVSFYPSIMASQWFKVPLKEPEWETLDRDFFDDEKNLVSLGHYHCYWEEKVFGIRPNKTNWWCTSEDVKALRERGVKITMIQDGKENAMVYRGSGIPCGSTVFGPYVKEMFKYKQAGIGIAKELLSSLWGVLCEANEYPLEGTEQAPLHIYEGRHWQNPHRTKDGSVSVDIVNYQSAFETPFARIKEFLTSAGRRIMANLLMSVCDKVIAVQTDGFILSEYVDFSADVTIGEEMGNLRMEKEGWVRVKNVNTIHWWSEERERWENKKGEPIK